MAPGGGQGSVIAKSQLVRPSSGCAAVLCWPRLRGSSAWPQTGLAAPPWAPKLFPLAKPPPLWCSGRPCSSFECCSKASRGGTHSFCLSQHSCALPGASRTQSWFQAGEAFLGLETRLLFRFLQLGSTRHSHKFVFCFFSSRQSS